MEEDFYASIKLKSGEEIFARVIPLEEKNKIILLVTNPIIIKNIDNKRGRSGYKIEPWMKTTDEDTFIINMDDIITLCETKNDLLIKMHDAYIKKINSDKMSKSDYDIRKMGYISNITEAKSMLEKIYRDL